MFCLIGFLFKILPLVLTMISLFLSMCIGMSGPVMLPLLGHSARVLHCIYPWLMIDKDMLLPPGNGGAYSLEIGVSYGGKPYHNHNDKSSPDVAYTGLCGQHKQRAFNSAWWVLGSLAALYNLWWVLALPRICNSHMARLVCFPHWLKEMQMLELNQI